MPEDADAGTVIADRYRLVAKLGEGGMGSVWKAEHLKLRSSLAIKLIDPNLAATDEGVERFLREAQAAAALQSRHVVQTFDYGVDAGTPFIAMEMLSGESLAERLERQPKIPINELAQIMRQVASAMTKAHGAGIVHRDLKPDNIFLAEEDDEVTAKVLDFGIAKILEGEMDTGSGGTTKTGTMLGTPYYMSPEQARGRSIDHRTDVWSLGVIVYEGITGERPFMGDALGDLLMNICTHECKVPSAVTEVPAGFDEWYAKATDLDPAERFQSAKELALALIDIGQGHGPDSLRRASQAIDNTRLTMSDDYGKAPAADTVQEPLQISASEGELKVTTASPNSVDVGTAAAPPSKSIMPVVAGLGITAVLVVVGAVALFSDGDGERGETTVGESTAEEAPAAAQPKPAEIAAPEVPAPEEPEVTPAPSASVAEPEPETKPTAPAPKPIAAPKPTIVPRPAPRPRVSKPKPAPKPASGDPFSSRKIGGSL